MKSIAEKLNSIDASGKRDEDLGYPELFHFPEELEYGSYFIQTQQYAPAAYISDMDSILKNMQLKTAAPASNGTDAQTTNASNQKMRPAVVPLAAVLCRLVASPMLVCQPDIDEVRIHTYCFNPSAGKQAGQNIGNFPIILNDLIESIDPKTKKVTRVVTGRTSVDGLIGLLLGQMNKAASPFYGHSLDYEKKKILQEANAQQAVEVGEGDSASPVATEAAKKAEEEVSKKLADLGKNINSENSKYMSALGITGVDDTSFRPPRVKIQHDVVPAYGLDDKTNPTKKIMRIHVYDERAAGVGKKANFLVSLLNSQSGISSKVNDAKLPDEIERIVTKIVKAEGDQKDKDTYYAIKDKESARRFISDSYPTLIIGSDSGIITNASFTSQPAGDVASAYLLTALEGGTTTDPTGATATSDIVDDILITPTTITLTMLGNILVTRGQTYYVDFNTGTTLDNTYTVTSVSHAIKPGGFSTTVTMAPVFSATMKSASKQINEIVSLLNSRAT